jgi:hypothetical protein
MHVVLIETSGNQRYIFATNKLRENVGASELTYRVGTQWTLEADERLADLWPRDENAAQLRRNLLDQQPIGENGNQVEVIVATSGKALLLVDNRETGSRIIRAVTTKVLKQAPGIDVCGVIGGPFELDKKELGDAIREVHNQLDRVREDRPGVALRLLRLPVVMECATSGLPAAVWDKPEKGQEPSAARSAVSIAKRKGSKSYGPRMERLLRLNQISAEFANNIGVLEKYCDWLAVVHADGNGIGQIFEEFWKNSSCKERRANGAALEVVNREFIDFYRRFSIALDVCTEEAFISALDRLRSWKNNLRSLRRIKENRDMVLPILPIVLGGDDLTVVCDGQVALQFTRDFLTQFERQTSTLETNDEVLQRKLTGVIPLIAQTAIGVSRLSACAGIAIVKPHFPFSAAYKLAEQLIRSAKEVKKKLRTEDGQPYPCSAIDFHSLYDASGSDLNDIRQRLRTDEHGTLLYGRPYVITPQELFAETLTGKDWAMRHDWQEFEKGVRAIFATDEDGRRRLPGSQLHDLRGGLFLGKDGADARYQLIRRRYLEQGITRFDEADQDFGKSLFFKEEIEEANGNKNEIYRTRLLDTLDAANFWVEEEQEGKNGNKEQVQ